MSIKCILVIDDEEVIQEVIQGCLEDIGEWEVITAGSGREGLLVAESQLPDGILLDVSMPEMDGLETLQKLQLHPVTQSIPIVLLTAKVQPADQARFSQLAVAGVIPKPFDPLILVDLVANAFHWDI
ncbi:response regulator [Anabaena cylindrica UHCC 0172]|uniref:response regulator n=1 Tax=Anabaena cylindrica TaxID=1165 RepID=UPI002B2151AA|nr:response regulator [Anabaena cylindrica]MEA5552467.1 response regulator [Anabaena cylindrica UHCC 0172]